MKYGFVAKHRGAWPIGMMCEALGVSRSSQRSRDDERLGQQARQSFLDSDRTYGARRVWRDVLEAGFRCGLHRIERLLRMQALRARPRRRGLPVDRGDRSGGAIAPNLQDRQFQATAPNQKWVADFTYLWTAEGWLFVAVVLDLYSRRAVGWSMQSQMTAQLVTDALMMAIWRRGQPDALLHHSDRGSQYTSDRFRRQVAGGQRAVLGAHQQAVVGEHRAHLGQGPERRPHQQGGQVPGRHRADSEDQEVSRQPLKSVTGATKAWVWMSRNTPDIASRGLRPAAASVMPQLGKTA